MPSVTDVYIDGGLVTVWQKADPYLLLSSKSAQLSKKYPLWFIEICL